MITAIETLTVKTLNATPTVIIFLLSLTVSTLNSAPLRCTFEPKSKITRACALNPYHPTYGSYCSSHHIPTSPQSVEVWLRSQSFLAGLPPSTSITLDALHSPRDPYDKPPYTMHQLAAVAIYSHPRQKASSSEIRDMLKERYPYYTDKKELSETLKHALSSYFLFKRTSRVSTQPGRGGLWELDVLTNPNGRRNRKRGSRQNSASLEEDTYDDFGTGLHAPGMPYPPSELAGPSLPPYPRAENRLYTFSQPSYSVDSPGSEGSSASDTSPGKVPSPEFLAAQNHYLMESQAFALNLRGLETLPRSRSGSPYRSTDNTPSSEESLSYHRRSPSTQRRGLPSRTATPSTSSSPSRS
ncbi:hypothetical protein BDZ89DRAFT_945830 [Hymenopellis radicata]|nr:hypothetical protein BDZ89DRAFT_945830 [Hymenopellis radicata]